MRKIKKQYYLLLIIIITPFVAYYLFVNTEWFVPKQKELSNSKGLFKELFREITKFDKESDTIYFSEGTVLLCGNNGPYGLSKYEKKMIKINYIKQNPYFIYIDRRSIDEVSLIDNKVIISGITGGCKGSNNCFHSEVTEFDINSKKGVVIYSLNYKIIDQNTVQMDVTGNSEKKIKLLMKYKNGNWSSSKMKLL